MSTKLKIWSREDNNAEPRKLVTLPTFAKNSICFMTLLAAFVLVDFHIFRRRGASMTTHLTSSATKKDSTTATSGKVFRIVRNRNYDRELMYFQNSFNNSGSAQGSSWPKETFWNRPDCKHWGAATTIFPPTVAVEQLVALDGWCLVVAGDRKGPASYQLEQHQDKVVFLSQQRQQELAERFEFVKKTPWNHFARKNVAYLYAVANNAQYIWDFDDDNILLLNQTLSQYTEGGDRSKVLAVDTRNNTECGVFNPYPFFRSSEEGVWPRGYPLDKINAPECQLSERYCAHEVLSEKIGIYQSLADKDPDVDAVYRLTRRLPVTFAGAARGLPVLVPFDTMSPMNAQASLFSPVGFWSMFLPTTVHGRVSDIWRSYIAQTVGKQCGMLVTFVGPHVIQDRNAHTYLADMDAEKQLYERSGGLVSYLLNQWKYDVPQATLEGAWERLYVDLYERGIVEREDVELAQLWISSLHSVGYKFPLIDMHKSANKFAKRKGTNCKQWQKPPTQKSAIVPKPIPVVHNKRICELANVVFVGQFNFDTKAQTVKHWVKRWKEVFTHVHVRGPFNQSVMATLQNASIQVFRSKADEGWYSPMKNLADTLRLVANDSSICGVAIAHDDLLINMTNLEERGFPSADTIVAQFPSDFLAMPNFIVYPNATFKLQSSGNIYPAERFNTTDFIEWGWWYRIFPNLTRAVASASGQKYLMADDGGIEVFGHNHADFLYIPTRLTEQFATHADWMVKNEIMLEVGLPLIVSRLIKECNAPLQYATLCTEWNYDKRQRANVWLRKCFRDSAFGTFHPAKIRILGTERWDYFFDKIVLGT